MDRLHKITEREGYNTNEKCKNNTILNGILKGRTELGVVH